MSIWYFISIFCSSDVRHQHFRGFCENFAEIPQAEFRDFDQSLMLLYLVLQITKLMEIAEIIPELNILKIRERVSEKALWKAISLFAIDRWSQVYLGVLSTLLGLQGKADAVRLAHEFRSVGPLINAAEPLPHCSHDSRNFNLIESSTSSLIF